MNEIDYGSVFGEEAAEGANESAPAGQTTAEAPETEHAAGEKETVPAGQSAEENARYAAARRKAERERDAALAQARAAARERDAAVAQAQAAAQRRQRMLLDEQITAIGKLDPSVKTVADLLQREEYPRIYGYVRRGLSVTDAFKLANYDTLTQTAAAVAKQAALNAASSKEHLAPTQTRGSGALTVPKDVKELYRLYNPDATDAEIREHYNRSHRE